MKQVFISIINFNGTANTLSCLDSLIKIKKDNISLRVLIIDNASKEPISLDPARYPTLPIHVIHNQKNLGFAGGHNVGIEYALKNNADYIVILNNDTFVKDTFLEELLRVIDKDEKIGVVSPKIYFAGGYEFHKDRYKREDQGKVFWYAGGVMDWGNVIGKHRGVDEVDKGQYDDESQTDFATGCCMLIKAGLLKKSGTFDDRYFLYYEDADLQERIKKLGYKIFYVPKSVIWHKNAGSAGGSGSILQDYYISRNRLLFGYLYADIHTKLALLKESIHILFSGRKWQKKGVWDFYLGRFGGGSFKPGEQV